MIDRVYGRDLPDMRDWGQALLDEAIRCKVQFGVLVLGQGMVTARLLRATPSAKMVLVHVTHDPRGWMADVEYPAEMRYVSEIRQAGSGFSLMRPQRQPGHNTATVAAARRLLARAKSAAAQTRAATSGTPDSAESGMTPRAPVAAPPAAKDEKTARAKPSVQRILRFADRTRAGLERLP